MLVLGVPNGKGSAARLLNRDDARQLIAEVVQELHGLRVQVSAEERADVELAEEQPLPEDELVRRVVREFEAEEITESGGAVAAGPNGEGS
ncbi:hypothetical protein PAI11_24900 [Patulibacter medicamentivorans]|uniref:Uncharacterized protein n=1 Tax=Patulibacter medicamentivorans TaxID=1097667 RepID=H0E6N9_9ACTN|nr:hypothetical protein PAI11_24900 [Patulibacter medicamentivorans]